MKNESIEPLLTICIPTYSRDAMLDKCLAALYKIQELGHRFCLIIADNCSEDNTKNVIQRWQPKFENIETIFQESNLGPDRNMYSLYMAVKTEYCWLLGDCDTISPEHYARMEKVLYEGYNVVVINTEPGKLPNERKIYSNIEDFLDEQGWHVTKLSACVVKKEMLNPIFIKRYFDTHFVQWGQLMEYLCQTESINILFEPSVHLGYLEDNGNYRDNQKGAWRKIPFYVWAKCWSQMILSLPFKIPCELKLKVIKDHERQFHWFSIRNLLKNKIAYGKSYIENYKENRTFVRMVSVASPFWSDVVMYLPVEYLYRLLRPINNTCKYVWKGTKKHIKKVAKKILRRGSK